MFDTRGQSDASQTRQTLQVLFKLRQVTKSYPEGRKGRLYVLDKVNLCILKGAVTGIVGESGCGKSTLMHILGTLDRPDSGQVSFDGMPLDYDDEGWIDEFRKKEMAFIFQDFNLFSHLDVLGNAMLPLNMRGVSGTIARAKAIRGLANVGIKEKSGKSIYNLSGGERQRVAIARALASNAEVILADEPTGNLDSYNTRKIMELLKLINQKRGVSMVLVTHDKSIARDYCNYIIDLEQIKENPPPEPFYGVPARHYVNNKTPHSDADP